MPSTLDSVKPIGVEVAAGNASAQTYQTPTELNPHQDAVSVAGVHLQDTSATSSDKAVWVDRQAANLRFSDSTTQRLLSELVTSVSGGVNDHEALRSLEHLIGSGPGPAFTGAYMTRTYNGVLPLVDTWWTSNAQANKILTKARTYPAGSVFPSSVVWTVYSAAGAAVQSLTQSLNFSGALLVSATRT